MRTDSPVLKRLDVNVAGAQLYCFFEHVIDGANNGRSAGKVAKALDVVVTGTRGFTASGRSNVFVDEALIEDRLDILERCDADIHFVAEHDRRSANGGRIAWVGDREHHRPVRRTIGKHHHFAQETWGELF